MQTTLSYRHRVITNQDLVFIRSLIAQRPGASRWGLSKKLCVACQIFTLNPCMPPKILITRFQTRRRQQAAEAMMASASASCVSTFSCWGHSPVHPAHAPASAVQTTQAMPQPPGQVPWRTKRFEAKASSEGDPSFVVARSIAAPRYIRTSLRRMVRNRVGSASGRARVFLTARRALARTRSCWLTQARESSMALPFQPHSHPPASDAPAPQAGDPGVLALLLQRTEQGFWFIDNELQTTDANPAMCRMLGWPLSQMLGRSIYEFVDEANAAIFRERVRLRALGHAEGYEVALLHSDGSTVNCYNNATPLFDAAGYKVGAVGMFSDISPLKRAEQQVRLTGELLAQKTQVLEATLNSLSQGVLSFDAQGRINAWNHRCLDLLELPVAYVQTRPTFDDVRSYQAQHGLLPGVDHSGPLLATPYQRARHDGAVIEVQVHRVADGSTVRTYTDVTASVLAEQALRESETRFRAMADSAPALIRLTDAAVGATWFNQRWLQYTGRSAEQELSIRWSQRLAADEYEVCRARVLQAVAQEQGFELEYRLMRRDGSHAWIAETGIPRFAPDGHFEGFIVYGWDITDRKLAQAALQAAKNEAERANRAKSDFLSRMSHELRTPLNAVLGFGQLMELDRSDPLSPGQRARVHELMRGGRHLLDLINEVLDLARIEAGTLALQLTSVDLAAVADDCQRLVQSTAGLHHISLLPLATAVPCHVQADATRLKQVLLNLLSNAIKYNRPGGWVQLGWQFEAGRGTACIEVQDSGPGLDRTQQERLFQAFERLQAEGGQVEGAGIGLALSKWLVELMQGEMGVRSVPGQGSTFWLRLACSGPLAPAPAPMALDDATRLAAQAGPARVYPIEPAEPAGAASCPRTVLYIEDNVVNQVLMEGLLSHRPNWRLLIAGLPEVGLSIALQSQPDLILLDIQLPGIDGFEVLRRLRAQPATQHIPVIAVSANAMPGDTDAALAAGFNEYLTKPLSMQGLLATLDRTLGR